MSEQRSPDKRLYAERGPIRRMEGSDSDMTPIDEMKRAQQIWEARHGQ